MSFPTKDMLIEFELVHGSTEVPTRDSKFEGCTSFLSGLYRYAIELKNNKLSIWMENRNNKKQWYTGDLDKQVYVTADNALIGASTEDYLQLFQGALSCPPNDYNNSRRELTERENGVAELRFILKLRVLHATWEAKFEFLLDPVSVERIDILEAQLYDHEEELKKINTLEAKLRQQQEKLDKLEVVKATPTSLAEFKAVRTFDDSKRIKWIENGSDELVKNCDDGTLKIRRDGVYLIAAVIERDSERDGFSDDGEEDDDDEEDEDNEEVSLLKNGECIQYGYFAGDGRIASPMTVARLKSNDELLVTVTCMLANTSTLFITRLAD
ncbi:hypothetical protein PInf_014819 [Phytophthora infestans]|nr:hypothetical protein PInf_014819 [Phytophthora infestans]